jgi:hypothetical protein
VKKFSVFLCSVALIFTFSGTARPDLILFGDFEDSSAFGTEGSSATYWGLLHFSGIDTYSPHFTSRGRHPGSVFYGAKANNSTNATTITISLPELTRYTNLHLTVALVTKQEQREEGQIDGFIMSGIGPVDNFLPGGSSGAYLQSQVQPVELFFSFRGLTHFVDGSSKSLVFAFRNTWEDEVTGISSVRITGSPIPGPVPKRATMLLFGSCLLGVAAVGKRKFFKKA